MDADQPSPLAQTVERLLRERGPQTLPDLTAAVVRSGSEVGPDPEEVVEDVLYEAAIPAAVLAGGRWAWGPDLLVGRTFTHRLTAAEIEHDLIPINPDLAALLAFDEIDEFSRLTDQSPVRVGFGFTAETDEAGDSGQQARPVEAYDASGSLELPSGTLRNVAVLPGELLGLAMTPDGIELSALELVGDSATIQHQLTRVVSATPEEPVDVQSAVLTVCAEDPDAFRAPVPPLTEIVAATGLVHDGDFLARPDFDFPAHRTAARIHGLAERYDLAEDEALGVLALSRVYQQFREVLEAAEAAMEEQGADSAAEIVGSMFADATGAIPRPPAAQSSASAVRSVLPFLADPVAAHAFLSETIGEEEDGAAALGLMVETLEEQADRPVRPALRWLRAKARERVGDAVEAERQLQAAERLDPDWPPILYDLARYAADRSDAPRGLRLLRRLGPGADPVLEQTLERFVPEPGPTLGRNQPCWCGSGRKFKQCHLHRQEQAPLEQRAWWLYQKATWYLADGPWRKLRVAVAAERAAYAADEEEVRRRALDPLVADALLFEGGAFEEFLQVRGPLLPADERLLGEQWLLLDRSVFEVTAVDRGRGFTVRDLRTGDRHDVSEATASRTLQPGALICARVVPAGIQMQIFGGIEPVALVYRDALLELLDRAPDPEELVAFCSRRFAPPTVLNTDGHPLTSCEARLTTTAPDRLIAALDEAYRRVEDEPKEWLHERTIDGLDRICATLTWNDGGLAVNTNSEPRMDDVSARLRTFDPEPVVVSDRRRPMADVVEEARDSEPGPSPSSHPRSNLRKYGRRWRNTWATTSSAGWTCRSRHWPVRPRGRPPTTRPAGTTCSACSRPSPRNTGQTP